MTIHWCGTGLSAVPGLRRLLQVGHEIIVYELDVDKAQNAVGDLTTRIKLFDTDKFNAALRADDIVVSMLPGDWHVPLAKLCILKKAHFVCSSYISAQMEALDDQAKLAGVRLVNEVGLDPGIDHVLAHHLVSDYRASTAYHVSNEITFRSFCGGIPKHPNAFRYKFSWSPYGVLKALLAPSVSIRAYSTMSIKHPWDAVTTYTAPLPEPEEFEVYPNRDSLPYLKHYRFGASWKIKEFVRGTLRLSGWTEAWANILVELEMLTEERVEPRLRALSDQLAKQHSYAEGEPDRVVMFVSFKAEQNARPVYHKTFAIDAWGDARGSAMARLVSESVALAVEAVEKREIPVGVSAAPHDPKLVSRWLRTIDRASQYDALIDHLA
jgi:saccharopine dehydrogenase (NADP+, L-glutamate forming)